MEVHGIGYIGRIRYRGEGSCFVKLDTIITDTSIDEINKTVSVTPPVLSSLKYLQHFLQLPLMVRVQC